MRRSPRNPRKPHPATLGIPWCVKQSGTAFAENLGYIAYQTTTTWLEEYWEEQRHKNELKVNPLYRAMYLELLLEIQKSVVRPHWLKEGSLPYNQRMAKAWLDAEYFARWSLSNKADKEIEERKNQHIYDLMYEYDHLIRVTRKLSRLVKEMS